MTEEISSGEATWVDLCSHFPFLIEYKCFLKVVVAAKNLEDLGVV